MKHTLVAVSVSLLATTAIAQVKPGEALLSCPGTIGAVGNSGHLVTYNLTTGAVTRLGGMSTYSMNRGVVLEAADRGFWGGGGSTGHVDRFVISGNNLTVTRWNTTSPTGGDIRDLEVVNGRVYFTCWEGSTQTNRLYSLPIAQPGPMKLELDLRAAGYVISGPQMAQIGGKIYMASRNRADIGISIIEFDPATSSHKKVFERGLTTGHVQGVATDGKELFVVGEVARAFAFDVKTGMQTRSIALAGVGGNARPRNCVYIPETDDLLVSSRNGTLDYYVIDGPINARSPNVGGHAPDIVDFDGPSLFQAALGMDYLPFTRSGSFHPTVSGCLGDANRQPTSWAAGNMVWRSPARIGVHGRASAPAILMLGSTGLNVDLTAAGAPGCFLGQNFDTLFVPLALNATGAAELPYTTPPVPFYVQWAVFDGSNQLQLSFTETRFCNVLR